LSQPPTPVERARLTPVERGLRLFTDVRAGEGRTALLMFANVCLILCAYYVLKPLREGWLAISNLGDLSKLELKAYTSFGQTLLLAVAAASYGRLVERWPRAVLISRATLFCMSNVVVFWLLQPDLFVPHMRYMGILYYLWVGMFGVFVVAQFWAFAADLYSQERGKRLLPMVAIGATAGAVFGSWLERTLVSSQVVDPEHMILLALPPLALSILLTRWVDAQVGGVQKQSGARPEGEVLEGRNAFSMVLGNRFLLAVAVTTLLLTWVKTNGENVLFDAVNEAVTLAARTHGIHGGEAIRSFVHAQTTVFYGGFYFWVNVLALALQALVASRLLRYGGFGWIFLLLPTIALTAYSAMAIVPLLWVIKTAKIAENATDYSIHNTARHVLWLPMSHEVTFKAKPTIDSLFFRAGDGMAALTVLVGGQVFSALVRSIFLVNVALVLGWLALAIWIVREYARLSGGAQMGRSPSPGPGAPRRAPEAAEDESPQGQGPGALAGARAERASDPRPAWGGGR
jgi:AAA family ATP:ADP antiporter